MHVLYQTIVIDVMPLEYVFVRWPSAQKLVQKAGRTGEGKKRGLLMEIFAVNGDDSVKVIMALY